MTELRMIGCCSLLGFAMNLDAAPSPAAKPAAPTAPTAPAAGSPAAGSPAALTADSARSQLEFSGIQAGAPFKGVFKKFSATVAVDPNRLAISRIDVQIDLGSLDSQDGERDKSMRGPDFFDVAHTPSAHYVTRAITKTASGYAATGSLTLRGVTKDVPIEFQYTPGNDGATLTGTSEVKRLDFGVGRGEWKSTEWVGDAVKIKFSLSLKPAH